MRLIDANAFAEKIKEISDKQGYNTFYTDKQSVGEILHSVVDELTGNTIYGYENCPTVEAIPKADYENRLKTDMVAMLKEIKKEIDEQCKIPNNNASAYDWNNGVYACYKVVQQRIDALKRGAGGSR